MPFGEGRADKPPQDLLDRPDIADMFRWPYVFDGAASPAGEENDPGRIRNEAFFAKMYGDCEKQSAGGMCKCEVHIKCPAQKRALGFQILRRFDASSIREWRR